MKRHHWAAALTMTLAPISANAQTWWSLKPLVQPAIPQIRNPQSAIRNPIDSFIQAKLASKGMKPSPPADRRTLLRRVYYDLIGLPPSPAEVDAFIADKSPRAYEKVVDRLLASPRYGERWGRHWLDVVHYADTHGYDKDKRRDHAYPYRDYVIRAFNLDMPYSQFVREQLAGDVLGGPYIDEVTATGFIAAGPWDFVGNVELAEGTVEKEKTRLLDRDDMVSNAISTFNSVTIHCARCHDHKFDPIPQRDYYRLQAVFAGVERGNREFGPRANIDGQIKNLKEEQARFESSLLNVHSPGLDELDATLAKERGTLKALPPDTSSSPTNGYHSDISATPNITKWVQIDLGETRTFDEVRLYPARPIDFADTPGFGFPLRFKIESSDDSAFTHSNSLTDRTSSDFPNPGNEPVTINAATTARFVRITASKLWTRTNDYVFALGEVQVISKGKNVAEGSTVTSLDSIEAGRWSRRYLVDGFDSRISLTGGGDKNTALRAELTNRIKATESSRRQQAIALLSDDDRTKSVEREKFIRKLEQLAEGLPAPELTYAAISRTPRPIRILARGDVEQGGEPVGSGALACIEGLKSDFQVPDNAPESARRVALAEWITDYRNVLTWRSIVNRVWHYHFGKGIVDTPNDFGKNGGKPSHPELLDWLAMRFRNGGQSIKSLHRLILLSQTYQQSSKNSPEYARIDSDNRLLWRMNRQRLDAESIRDSILAVSGKLDLTMGGPGFEMFRFKDDHSPIYDHSAVEKINDPKTWRRTVYAFTVRSVQNPFLECLDCADPNINTPVRNTTLTALQALALLNDPFILKQSELFAERVRAISPNLEEQAGLAVRFAFGRRPTPAESKRLSEYAKKNGLANMCRILLNANEFVFVD